MNETLNWRSGEALIHSTCASGGQSWFQSDDSLAETWKRSTQENWRDKKTLRKSVGTKMFHNKNIDVEKVEKKATVDNDAHLFENSGMKYCPGDCCKIWLPRCQFANNYNMVDGMDTYCVECNKRKREQRGTRRLHLKQRYVDIALDEFEQFQERKLNEVGPKFNLERRALAKIAFVVEHTNLSSGTIDTDKIYNKLFSGRRLCCDYTGQPMTLGCFVDHHEIEFQRDGKRLNVNCTGTTAPLW